jgi:hypothetical protein
VDPALGRRGSEQADVKGIAQWTSLAVLVGLWATYVSSTSRRLRRHLFLAICGLGAAVGIYGHVLLFLHSKSDLITIIGQALKYRAGAGPLPSASPTSYFAGLGLPLSAVIGLSLVFGILELDNAFTKAQLRRRIYPGLAWLFVTWIVLFFGVELSFYLGGPYSVAERGDNITVFFTFNIRDALVSRGGALLLLIAFVLSATLKFRPRLFQVLFPLATVLLFVSLVSEGVRRPRPLEELLFLYLWWAFWLMAYFYLNAKYHADLIRSPFLKRIPKAGMLMVGLGVLHDFPEYEKFRSLLPAVSHMAERVLCLFDLGLLLVLSGLVISGRVLRVGSVQSE